MATWTLKQVGAKFTGKCIICGLDTDKQPLAVTPLYTEEVAESSESTKDKYGVAHAECVGAKVKRAVSGPRLVGTPMATIGGEAKADTSATTAKLEELAAELGRLAQQRPASATSVWFFPDGAADLIKRSGLSAEDTIAWAESRIAKRREIIAAEQPGRKIEIK